MSRLRFAVTFVIYLFFFPLWVLISFPLFFQIESGCEIRVPELRFLPPVCWGWMGSNICFVTGWAGNKKVPGGESLVARGNEMNAEKMLSLLQELLLVSL